MIDELKSKGWRIDVIHERRHTLREKLNGMQRVVNPRGGRTVVILTDPYHGIYTGVAQCADEDNYCKKTGRLVALARAMVQTEEFRMKVPNLFVR
jgi:hypothetical protein